MLRVSVDTAERCIKENGFNTHLACVTPDYREALRFIDKNPGIYLYFLDIDLGQSSLNGVDAAKLIKKAEPLSKIVFVTSHAELGMSVLKSGVEAFGFIEKTVNTEKTLAAYKRYISLALDATASVYGEGSAEKRINLLIGVDEYITLPVSQILYVEADKLMSHFIRYHTVDGSELSVRDTIENVLKELGGDFMKSHRSVIVNKNQVVSVSDGLVKFAGGETAACSFRLQSDVAKKCAAGRVLAKRG
jgi:DNA-binding LytR/AlgR family response regulator